jgi:hypothetical protein
MASDAGIISTTPRSRLRLRFSLLALLVVITIICLILGWWQFIYLEEQRLIRRRDILEKHVAELSVDLKRKWEDYLDIARGMGTIPGDGEKELQQVDLKRLDRIDAELMRIEGQLRDLQAKGNEKELESRKKQITELRKQQYELEKNVQARATQSAELETRHAELDHQQRMIDTFSEELERLNIEAEVRGIRSK